MSAYTPNSGDYFYLTWRMREMVRGGLFNEAAVVEKFVDRSYSQDVLRCVARDDSMVLFTVVGGGALYDGVRKVRRHEVTFAPVGPDVLKALGLTEEPGATP